MAKVTLAPAIARWMVNPPSPGTNSITEDLPGRTIAEVLIELFERYPSLKSYICQDDGTIRPHVVLYLDNQVLASKRTLSIPVSERSEIHLFQALSGG